MVYEKGKVLVKEATNSAVVDGISMNRYAE
jgi:hypothetical protein